MESNGGFSAEYIERFLAGYFDELVENQKPFLRDLGINIPEDATAETVDDDVRERVEEAVLLFDDIIHDRVPFMEIYGLGKSREDCLQTYFYSKMSESAPSLQNPISEKRKQLFNGAIQYGYDMDIEELDVQIRELKKAKKKKFDALLEANFDDVKKCCPELLVQPEIFEKVRQFDYQPNVEGTFEKYMACVMVLKASDMFTPSKQHKLRSVKLIGGGYLNDGISDGFTFNFDDVNYEFSNGKKKYSNYNKIELTDKNIKEIKKINSSCYNSFDFEKVKFKNFTKSDNVKEGKAQ